MAPAQDARNQAAGAQPGLRRLPVNGIARGLPPHRPPAPERRSQRLDQTLRNTGGKVSASEKSLKFRADIQGLRALAVLGIVVFHMNRSWLPGGFAGVDVFFVISGFLISRIILTECASGEFSLSRFYSRRAKRILPALLVVIGFVVAFGWRSIDPAEFREIGAHVMGNSYFTVNLWLLRQATEGYFAPGAVSKPLLHLWSLSIEEQFYLVWAILMLAIFRLGKASIGAVIAAILIASLANCVILTPVEPVAAFYLPWTRGWELALGAALAYREVYLASALPYPSRATADIGAALGVALILGAYVFLSETQDFPGWRAIVPTAGCALVIAHPGSTWATAALRHPVAAFFGLISYPLYLWHWPLFAFARGTPGILPTAPVMLALGALAVALAALTYRLVERPLDRPFRKRRNAVAIGLVAALALTGLAGRQIYRADGFPGRFPPLVARIFAYTGGVRSPLASCLYDREQQQYPIAEQRERTARYFADRGCLAIADRAKPTIMVVGDSHAAHLLEGLAALARGRANLVALTATYCTPLIERVEIGAGESATPRCQAINDFVFERIRAIKPDILVVGAYFDQYLRQRTFIYPGYADELSKSLRRLHDEGVRSIVVAGQVPLWSPWMRVLVGRDVLERGWAPEYSTVGLEAGSLDVDRELKRRDWGEGAAYVSQASSLCDSEGCRRLVGPSLPDDILSFDYGHYTVQGSLFAVRTMFAPAIDAALAQAARPQP
jgi:peptidoglycan/LPS O-acetylase OafA/YrhL